MSAIFDPFFVSLTVVLVTSQHTKVVVFSQLNILCKYLTEDSVWCTSTVWCNVVWPKIWFRKCTKCSPRVENTKSPPPPPGPCTIIYDTHNQHPSSLHIQYSMVPFCGWPAFLLTDGFLKKALQVFVNYFCFSRVVYHVNCLSCGVLTVAMAWSLLVTVSREPWLKWVKVFVLCAGNTREEVARVSWSCVATQYNIGNSSF
jgi:hypothetical protein